MYKLYCDICGEEIKSSDLWSKYKIKKRWRNMLGDVSYWDRLSVHNDCWQEMCDYIKEKRND